MSVTKKVFGTCPAGEEIYLYTLTNAMGLSAQVMNYGAILVSVTAPDISGKMEDVVLGFDTLAPYFKNPSFFGATVGPNANRIGGAQFQIEGQICKLDVNDGANNLHSHIELGFHKRVWHAEEGENSVRFSIEEKDGNLGFPGNRKCSVTYTLTDNNRLELHYHGESDKKTVLNMTNHTYFNLEGQGEGGIEDHTLWMKASRYTPVAAGAIPTGEIASVAGTPMDFTRPETVGKRINEDFEQLKITGGYDHNWVIDDYDGSVQLFATVKAKKSHRTIKAYTNLPGVQFYAGNFIDAQTGKNGACYDKRSGLCLETQFYPDTANKPEFPSAVFGSDRIYDYTTVYEFGVE